MKRFQNLLLLSICALTLLLSGCFTNKINIFVSADGSGTIQLDFALNKEQMIAFGAMSGNPMDAEDLSSTSFVSESDLIDLTSEMGEGVFFNSVSYYPDESENVGYSATYSFQDINKVTLNPLSNIPDLSYEGKKAGSFSFAFSKTDETSTLDIFSSLLPGKSKENSQGAGMQEDIKSEVAQIHPMLAPFMNGINIGVAVEFEAPINSTNALFATEKSVSIIDYRIGDTEISVDELAALLMYIDNPATVPAETIAAVGMNIDPQKKISVVF